LLLERSSFPKFKIFLCQIINPLKDDKCQWIDGGAVVLLRTQKLALSGAPSYVFHDKGQEKDILRKYGSKRSLEIIDRKSFTLLPSFFDLHFHWVQDEVRLMPKKSLLDWLSKHTWPYEAKFKSKYFSLRKAKGFSKELLKVGTLGGACYGSLHGHSVDHGIQFFEGDFILGNVLMTMNSPDYLTQSKENALNLIREKAKTFKSKYALTPRFAPTTHPDVMKKGASFANRHGCFIQTHLSETKQEIEYVLSVYGQMDGFNKVKSYTEIYQKCGILGPKTIMGHGIYLSEKELKILSKTKAAIAHCPTSNAPVKDKGLGSGLFDFEKAEKAKIKWALGSDIGGGPFLSMFDVINSFVKQNRKKKVWGATFVKGLNRSTLVPANILGIGENTGNIEAGKWANFIFVPSPPKKKGEDVDSFLKRLCSPKGLSRNDYKDLVVETFLKGHSRYSHLN
ncbi:MAG: amidohydrolase family protein, partial [Bdellovibrionota bacterium]|nr:amidohydrolase family protein [Bdellovibrionota bacterium]